MFKKIQGLVIIITGLSGSGKSTALKALEDNGFFCIDNLPVLFLPKLLAFREKALGEFFKLGIVMDLREPKMISNFSRAFEQVKMMGCDLKVVFLEADTSTLLKRFSETKRPHPLALGGDLSKGLEKEMELLTPLREIADQVIDTSNFNSYKLREEISARFADGFKREMSTEIISFGFKNGLPREADIVLDVRFLPNPFYIDELRELDGRNQRIKSYVFSFPEACEFANRAIDFLKFVLPFYRQEGRAYLAIALGCTGGHHRSVAMAEKIWKALDGDHKPSNVKLRHRDILVAKTNKKSD